MKLHLGCGKRLLDGCVNIDAIGGDRQMDIRKLDYPDESVDEILAVHVWEHFWLKDVLIDCLPTTHGVSLSQRRLIKRQRSMLIQINIGKGY